MYHLILRRRDRWPAALRRWYSMPILILIGATLDHWPVRGAAVVSDSTDWYPDLSVREHPLPTALVPWVADPAPWVDWLLRERQVAEKAIGALRVPFRDLAGAAYSIIIGPLFARMEDWVVPRTSHA